MILGGCGVGGCRWLFRFLLCRASIPGHFLAASRGSILSIQHKNILIPSNYSANQATSFPLFPHPPFITPTKQQKFLTSWNKSYTIYSTQNAISHSLKNLFCNQTLPIRLKGNYSGNTQWSELTRIVITE